ncbi:DNA alkylation repair protein [Dysgonomonas sp. ZJ279]|uniref:DNA alkylation repair protein n=1 Tax=Dysgonomonas sp. ZJ279 TaxID=2709796 RepID=UPI0021046B69|nr:DNA alkylation repair protein [Dysgonomonas sp. ZJ279]
MEKQEDIIRDIRTRCRMAMNGMASASMRERGLTYKLNFGLVIQQIKDLAGQYEANAELAETLWKEETRELKILSTFLYPIDKFSPDTANRWVTEIPNQEMREQVCLNLFQELPFADQLAIAWGNSEDENIRTSGYWLLVRLLLTKKFEGVLTADYFSHIWEDIITENTFLRNAALLILKHIGRQSKDEANLILEKVSIYKDDQDLLKQEAYNSLDFEFEFFLG